MLNKMFAEFNSNYEMPATPANQAWFDTTYRLIKEEVGEFAKEYREGSHEDMVKELIDIIYVTAQRLSMVCDGGGIDMDRALLEVHRSNMSKLCPSFESATQQAAYYLEQGDDVSVVQTPQGLFKLLRADGKVVKPRDLYSTADMYPCYNGTV